MPEQNRIQLGGNESYGNYLGRSEGCFIIKDKKGKIEEYPISQHRIVEAELRDYNSVSINALVSLAELNVETIITDYKGMPLAFLININDFSHVKTRVAQYESSKSIKRLEIATQIVRSKIEGQNRVLQKHGIPIHYPNIPDSSEGTDPNRFKTRLLGIEGKYASYYFNHIFELFPDKIRPKNNQRHTFKAYDGLNNVFNFGYQALRWRVQRALIKAKLEPYLGFLHSTQYGKPSLVCDFQEIYRYLIDDLLILRSVNLHKKDFAIKTEIKTKRLYLRDFETGELFNALTDFFDKTMLNIPRIKHGKKQSLDSLICEEASQFARYLRGETKGWIPRQPLI